MRSQRVIPASLILSLLVLSASPGRGQKVIDITNADADEIGMGVPMVLEGGEPYSMAKFVRVTEGSPFFSEQWMQGNLVLGNGGTCHNIPLRLNLLDNAVNYRDAKGDEMVATTSIKRIRLRDTIAAVEYNFVYGSELNTTDRNWQKAWFQVLVNDRVSLCKQLRKTVRETTPYGSATTEQTIATIGVYFIYMNKALTQLKKWNELLDLFRDKKDKLDPFIAANHIKGRSDQDYIQVVNYYNSLLPPAMTAER